MLLRLLLVLLLLLQVKQVCLLLLLLLLLLEVKVLLQRQLLEEWRRVAAIGSGACNYLRHKLRRMVVFDGGSWMRRGYRCRW